MPCNQPDQPLGSGVCAETGAHPERFLNTVSHGLRSPLTAIIAATELLLHASGPLTERQRRHAERVRANSQDMHDRVSDLLELSLHQADRVTLHLRPFDLEACAAEAIASIRPLALAQGVEVIHAPSAHPVTCRVDAARIVHLLRNLLSNAIRHTPTGGQIRLSREVQGAWIVHRIEDTGCGIAPARLETLFEPFYQGRSEGGDRLGIGLNVCRAIVERHGGTLSVESILGIGSSFSFTLPHPAGDEA
ncbi:HAMP domain-containing histidine kinase [bacterium]|nr:HAMP domain-containing histidine kinase [bacterium]